MQILKSNTFVLLYLFEYLYCIDSKIILHNYRNTTGDIIGNSLSIITESVVITRIECAKTCSLSKTCVGLFVKRIVGNLKICTLVQSQPGGDVSPYNSVKSMWIRQDSPSMINYAATTTSEKTSTTVVSKTSTVGSSTASTTPSSTSSAVSTTSSTTHSSTSTTGSSATSTTHSSIFSTDSSTSATSSSASSEGSSTSRTTPFSTSSTRSSNTTVSSTSTTTDQ